MAGLFHQVKPHSAWTQGSFSDGECLGAFSFPTVRGGRTKPWSCRAAQFHSGAESRWLEPAWLVPMSLGCRGLQAPQKWVWLFIPLATKARSHTQDRTVNTLPSLYLLSNWPVCPAQPPSGSTFHIKPQRLEVPMNEITNVHWFKGKLWAWNQGF